MKYIEYQHSRDAAWKILIDYQISELPVKISAIVKGSRVHLYSYTTGRPLIRSLGLERHASSCDGFTVRHSNNYYIFYNDQKTAQRIRFTIAHELGHIRLGHLIDGGAVSYTTVNREPTESDNPFEQQANVFASRILSPACVLWALGIKTPEALANLCDISLQSAKWRNKRMQELYAREAEFKQRYGKSIFLQSPLERTVYRQFQEYISTRAGDF